MGFFGKKKGGLGRIALAVGTGGASEVANAMSGGKVADLLMGKKGGGSGPDDIATQIRATQQKGIGELNKALDTPADQIVKEQAARQSKSVLTSAQDARRRAQQLMAQRGLQGSSLGLASDRSITMNTGEQLASINAAVPGQIRDQAIQDAKARINVGGLGTSAGINWNKIKNQRSGGLLGTASSLAPLVGSIGGMMAGGPAGASAGSSAGSMFKS